MSSRLRTIAVLLRTLCMAVALVYAASIIMARPSNAGLPSGAMANFEPPDKPYVLTAKSDKNEGRGKKGKGKKGKGKNNKKSKKSKKSRKSMKPPGHPPPDPSPS